MNFNIASLMEDQAGLRPFQRALVFPSSRDAAGNIAWTQLSFQQLNALTDAYARGLAARGVGAGERVSLLVKPRLEFIPLVFAVFKLGAVPVLIDPGMGRKAFLECLERSQPTVLIAEPVAHVLRQVFRAPFARVRLNISVGTWGGLSLAELAAPGTEPFAAVLRSQEDEAAILFTSGSTGPPKGVTYTHGIFHAQTRFIRDLYGLQGGEIDLAAFPLFGLFSMAIGMTVVIPEMDPTKPALADPARLVEAIQGQGCTQAVGSPAIWKNLGRYCEERSLTLPSLKRMLMFGAPIPVWMHEQFSRILVDGAQIHTPYGATESLPVASIATREVLDTTQHLTSAGAGTCVGRPVPEVQVRIIGIVDEAIADWGTVRELPAGEVGEITVAGPVVTHEYKDLPEATALAKIREPLPEGGSRIVHRMGDLGYLDEQGRLWFCGRKSHRIQLADGRTVFPDQLEGIFNTHPQVYRTALVGVNGQPVLCVERQPGATASDEALKAELLQLGARFEQSREVKELLFHPSFPVDTRHNAKIHRLQLREWAAGRLGQPIEYRPKGEV